MTDDTTSTTSGPAVPGGEQRGRISLLPWAKMGQKRQARLILGFVVLVVSIGYTVTAFTIPLGELGRPGAGMFPRAVGFGAIFISLWLIVESIVGRADPEDLDIPRGKQLRLVLIFFFGTVAFVILMPILGIYIAGSLYMVAMIKFLSDWPWWKAVVWGVGLAVALSWIFITLLQVPLPLGIFFSS